MSFECVLLVPKDAAPRVSSVFSFSIPPIAPIKHDVKNRAETSGKKRVYVYTYAYRGDRFPHRPMTLRRPQRFGFCDAVTVFRTRRRPSHSPLRGVFPRSRQTFATKQHGPVFPTGRSERFSRVSVRFRYRCVVVVRRLVNAVRSPPSRNAAMPPIIGRRSGNVSRARRSNCRLDAKSPVSAQRRPSYG